MDLMRAILSEVISLISLTLGLVECEAFFVLDEKKIGVVLIVGEVWVVLHQGQSQGCE